MTHDYGTNNFLYCANRLHLLRWSKRLVEIQKKKKNSHARISSRTQAFRWHAWKAHSHPLQCLDFPAETRFNGS